MLLRLTPLLAGIGPLLAAYMSFWIGVQADVLPACIPFIDGCASISATGRKPPGSFLFRALMFPQTILLLFTWFFAVQWLRALDSNVKRSLLTAIHIAGIVGSIALLLYLTFLGTREPFYEFMRRFGIYFAFAGMVLAEVFIAIALLRMRRITADSHLKRMAQMLLALSLAPFVAGFVNFYLKATLADADTAENVIEWIAATLMQTNLIVMYFMWRRTGFTVSARVASD